MKKFADKVYSYDTYHRDIKNQFTHFIGVPLIIFSLLLLGSHFVYVLPFSMNVGLTFLHHILISLSDIGVILLISYYLFLRSPSLYLIPTILILFLLLFLAQHYGYQLKDTYLYLVSLVCFVVGWIFQFLGHRFEGNKPALFDNLGHIFIAPIYLVSKLIMKMGFKIYFY